jgi:oxalate decarboxylase/phosphoglucose isomerase-like protein (cupin superfamily)
VIYILWSGAGYPRNGPTPTCQSGDVIKIPPGLCHHVVNTGNVFLELIIVYSRPLPASGALQG